MKTYPGSYMHLKRESSDPHKSNATDPTLCGREDPGLYMYATLEPGDAIPKVTEYPTCERCAEAHVAVEPMKG